MALLAADIGNTQTHLGVFDGDRLRESWRLPTDAEATGDELAVSIVGLFELAGLTREDVDAAIVSSVVPRLAPEYERGFRRHFGVECLVVGPSLSIGMPIRTESPHELGADRIVNAVAARERYDGPCVVVDFGTAITYDAISGDGEYLGGVIAPGIEISIEALARRAAALPKIELAEPEAVIGRTTQQSIQAGIVYGFAGQIDGILARLRGELGPATEVIATGGYAPAIVPFCAEIETVDDLLTLTGLRLTWERNR
ncbi:MAG TPA: type III pantothenate kinase [Solirubrobacterales bacterium]|nr:type III pantothenate kinase [Solirubrobacterales bacterium]